MRPRVKTSPATLSAWDKRYLWHPFTQQTEWSAREPFIVDSGEGVWLKDVRGRRVLDGVSSLWCNVFGHRKAALDAAIRRQLGKIAHATFLGATHEPAIRLGKELIALAPPPLSRVFYSDNGSTAVEVALKMALQYFQLTGQPKKKTFLSFKGSYHGDTIGAVSVGGIEMYHARFGALLFKGHAVDPFATDLFQHLERLFRDRRSELAAVIIEPLIQGASGMRVMPKGLLRHLARLCKKHDVLLIADEVLTGFGRTGTLFAVNQEKVTPDFLCLSKSLTGGYLPLAVTLTSERVFEAFLGRYDEFKTFFHGHTYTANPLACAVALATLALYKEERLIQSLPAKSRQLGEALALLERHPHVAAVRHLGLMGAIDLVADKSASKPYEANARMGLKACDAALRRGVWLRPLGDTIVILPPLAISAKELAFLLRKVTQAIEEVTAA
jgi:adenosylmethionine---8-amino-7-oxononanoate aminotransferase